MAAHTPGPWCVTRSDWGQPHFISASGDTPLVALCGYVSEKTTVEANACLIASAPNLRDVAEALILFHSGDPWDETKRLRWLQLTGADEATTKTLCDLARAAIAKATGE